MTGLISPGPGGSTPDASFTLALRLAAAADGRALLLSLPGLTVDAAAVSAGAGATTQDGVDAAIVAGIEDGRILVTPDRSDGFLAQVFPGSGVTTAVTFDISWSRRDGLRIHGGAGLTTTIALHTSIGPLLLDTLDVGLLAGPAGLQLRATVNGAAALGPFEAAVSGVPAAALPDLIEALLVTGIGDDDPADLFGGLVSEGRVGLLAPGTPTNSVAGAPAAPLAADADTWWAMLTAPAGPAAQDVSTAPTGDPARLGSLPGGDRTQRATGSALVTALWPALWGFAAGQVWDVARGRTPAQWAGRALFPEGAYPSVRVGPQPYGLLPTTSWSTWSPADGDPPLEAGLVQALLPLRARHAAAGGSATGSRCLRPTPSR